MNAVVEMQTAIWAAIDEAQECGGQLRITFKREKASDLIFLMGMIQGDKITLSVGDTGVVWAVYQSGDWASDDNRTMNITMAPTFEGRTFVKRLCYSLESIEVVRPPQAKKPKSNAVICQTCRKQVRPKVAEGGCKCNIKQHISDLEEFGYVPVKTQKPGALRKMKSPEGETVREEAFGVEVDKLLLG